MSTLKTGALRGTSGTADSVQLHASNQSVTFPGAVTVTGALTASGGGVGNVKHTQLTGVDLNGNSSVEFAVPSNTFHLWLCIRDLSTANSAEKYLDLKVGGSYVTSGYKSTAGFIENGSNPQTVAETNDGTWIFARNLAGASNTMTGIFDMKEFESNTWMHNWDSDLGNSGIIGISRGRIDLAGELQMIRVRADNGNFDDGRIVAHFLELV